MSIINRDCVLLSHMFIINCKCQLFTAILNNLPKNTAKATNLTQKYLKIPDDKW
jgi:hypothetical protein